MIARVRGLKVVTYHKSWSYVSQWLGLEEIGYVEPKPGIPPDPQHLARLIAVMKQDGAQALLVEDFYTRASLPSSRKRRARRCWCSPRTWGQLHL